MFIFIGIFIGVVLYEITFSKVFIGYSIKIIEFIKKVINFIIIKPIKCVIHLLNKIFKKPIHFIFVNIRKFKSKFSINRIKSTKKKKNAKLQKDLI